MPMMCAWTRACAGAGGDARAMSRRPTGPSDRPAFFYDDDMECGAMLPPPRLHGHGLLSKLFVMTLLLCCCGTLGVISLLLASLWASVSFVGVGLESGVGATPAPASTPARPQRSVLHRLEMLKRARPPERGIDRASMSMAFPQWLRRDDGGLNTDEVLSDVLLALSYLAQDRNK